MLLKIICVLAIIAVVSGKGIGYGGYGHGGYHLGYGFVAGGYPGGHGHGYHRPGIAKVQVHQTPYHYNYAVNEHGPGYNKYIHQGADFHYGHGGYGY